MVDKSKLKVFHVPFISEVKGTVSVLALDARGALAAVKNKVDDGSFGWDNDNLSEEGVLKDGSVNFNDVEGGDIVADMPVEQPNEKPEDHNDWDAFEDDNAAEKED